MTVEEELSHALDLLGAFVDEEPCVFDHHGACQSHSAQEVNGRCGNVVTLDFLDEQRPGWSEA